jgi:hypothetical protein
MFAIDLGNDGAAGPFLAWSARGTQDGAVPPQSFFVRDGGEKTPQDMSKGFVMDIDALKTGWQKSEGIVGVAPEWKWNSTPSQMMQSPGEEWKKGMSVRCAIGGGQTATWEQSGAAVWQALTGLAPELAKRPDAQKLPLVRMKEVQHLQFKRGSTVVPVLEVAQWVDRPDCLKEGVAAGIALEPTPQPAPQPAPQPVQPAPVEAAVLDDMEF